VRKVSLDHCFCPGSLECLVKQDKFAATVTANHVLAQVGIAGIRPMAGLQDF